AGSEALQKKAQEISADKPLTDATQQITRAAADVKSIREQFQQTQFQLVPSPYPGWHFTGMEIWGILASAGLLSLGAPFWFNALKGLSNLRSIVANKEQDEHEGKSR